MKRSKRIQLVLMLSAGALTSCGPSKSERVSISTDNVYTNNHQVPGVGYYHAPYHAWFPIAYNYFDPARKAYYHGGSWTPVPHPAFMNISSPTPQAVAEAQRAQAQATHVTRGGFGSTGYRHSIYS